MYQFSIHEIIYLRTIKSNPNEPEAEAAVEVDSTWWSHRPRLSAKVGEVEWLYSSPISC